VKEIPSVARQFRIRGVPTQIFLDVSGNEFHRHGGFYEYDHIVKVLRKEGI
jgi:thioredoxin-related protein